MSEPIVSQYDTIVFFALLLALFVDFCGDKVFGSVVSLIPIRCNGFDFFFRGDKLVTGASERVYDLAFLLVLIVPAVEGCMSLNCTEGGGLLDASLVLIAPAVEGCASSNCSEGGGLRDALKRRAARCFESRRRWRAARRFESRRRWRAARHLELLRGRRALCRLESRRGMRDGLRIVHIYWCDCSLLL